MATRAVYICKRFYLLGGAVLGVVFEWVGKFLAISLRSLHLLRFGIKFME